MIRSLRRLFADSIEAAAERKRADDLGFQIERVEAFAWDRDMAARDALRRLAEAEREVERLTALLGKKDVEGDMTGEKR